MYLLLSIFSGGLFLLDFIFLGGAAILFNIAYKASKSGSIVGGDRPNNPIRDGGGNMKLTQIPQFWFAVALVAAEIVSLIVRANDI